MQQAGAIEDTLREMTSLRFGDALGLPERASGELGDLLEGFGASMPLATGSGDVGIAVRFWKNGAYPLCAELWHLQRTIRQSSPSGFVSAPDSLFSQTVRGLL